MDHRTSSKFEGVELKLCSVHNKGEQFFEEKFFLHCIKVLKQLRLTYIMPKLVG